MVAKQAAELDPNNPVVVQLLWDAKFILRDHWAKEIRDQAEDGFVVALRQHRTVGDPHRRQPPLSVFGNAKSWADLTKSRSGSPATANASGRSARSKSRRSFACPCLRSSSPTPSSTTW